MYPTYDDPRRLRPRRRIVQPVVTAEEPLVFDEEPPKPAPSLRPRIVQPIVADTGDLTTAITEQTLRPPVRPRIIAPIETPPAPVENPYRIALRRREELNAPVKDENGRWKSAALGALGGLSQAFQTPVQGWDDFAGRLGGGIGGAVGGGVVNPRFDEQLRRRGEIAKADREIKRLEDLQENEIKRAKEIAEISNKRIAGEQAGLDLLKSKNKPLYESITADDVITEDEAEQLNESGYPVKPYDARKYKTIEVNGETLATTEKGVPDYQSTNAPKNLQKTPIEQTLADGTKVFTTGDKAIDREISQTYRQATLDMETGKYNSNQLSDFQDKLQKWGETEAERSSNIVKMTNEGNAFKNQARAIEQSIGEYNTQAQNIEILAKNEAAPLEARINELRAGDADSNKQEIGQLTANIKAIESRAASEATRLRGEARKAKTESVKLDEQGSSLLNQAKNSSPSPRPKMGSTIAAPQLGGRKASGKYANLVFRLDDALRSRFRGRSDAEIRQIIEGQGGKVN